MQTNLELKDTPLVVNKVKKTFFGFEAVKDVSFTVEKGEVLGIIGPNGAGKTTTIKMIVGLLTPDQGDISIFGNSILSANTRMRIGYMPETPSFYNHLTGAEILELSGELFGLGGTDLKNRIGRLIERVGLEKAGRRQLRDYSKGMLQRICLAQALINDPELLFLDEPLDGLDPLGRIRMKEILLDLKKAGTAIVFNSHILSDVEIMSDKIAIMDQGLIIANKSVEQLIPKNKTLEQVFIEKVTESHE